MKPNSILLAFAAAFTSGAQACPDGYYEACLALCACLPNSGTVLRPVAPVEQVVKYVAPVFKDINEAVTDLATVVRDNLARGVDALKDVGADAEKDVKEFARNTARESQRFGEQLMLAGATVLEFEKAQLSGQANNLNATLQSAREGRVIDALWTKSVQSLRITEQNAGDAALRSEYLRAVGQVAAGAYGGPAGSAAYAAWLAYKQTGDADLALRVGILTAASGYASQGAGQIDDSVRKAIVVGAIGGATIAAAGGSEAAVLQGFVKGTAMVVVQDGYKSFTSHDMNGQAATKDLPYCMAGQAKSCTPLPEGAIKGTDASGNMILDRARLDPMVPAVGLQDPSAFFNEANPVMLGLSRVPGVNAMAFLHDEWVAKWDMGAFATLVTIVPAIVITYTGFGVPLFEDIRDTAIESSLDAARPTNAPVPATAPPRSVLPDFNYVNNPSLVSSKANTMYPIDTVMCASKTGQRFGALLLRSFGPKFCSEGQLIEKKVKLGGLNTTVTQCLKKSDNWGSFRPNPHSSCSVTRIPPPKPSTVGQEPAATVASSVNSIQECITAFRNAVPNPLPQGATCMQAKTNREGAFKQW